MVSMVGEVYQNLDEEKGGGAEPSTWEKRKQWKEIRFIPFIHFVEI